MAGSERTQKVHTGLTAAVFIVVLTLQFGVPLCGIFTDACPRSRWTWAMFSGFNVDHGHFLVIDDEEVEVDPVATLGRDGRIPYGADRLARLCHSHPQADEAVRHRRHGGRMTELRVPCPG